MSAVTTRGTLWQVRRLGTVRCTAFLFSAAVTAARRRGWGRLARRRRSGRRIIDGDHGRGSSHTASSLRSSTAPLVGEAGTAVVHGRRLPRRASRSRVRWRCPRLPCWAAAGHDVGPHSWTIALIAPPRLPHRGSSRRPGARRGSCRGSCRSRAGRRPSEPERSRSRATRSRCRDGHGAHAPGEAASPPAPIGARFAR